MNGGTAPQSALRARLRRPDGAHPLRLPDDSHHRQHLRREGRRAARAGAGAGDRLRASGSPTMFGTLGTTFGLLGRAFGTFLANPWVIVPLALFFFAMGLSMFGAFEVALPSGLQGRLARVGGRGFLGRVRDGARRRDHRRPLHRAAAGVAAGLRGDDAQRLLGVPVAGDLRRRRGPALLAAGRLLDVVAAPWPLDGVGEERLRHRALRGGALLPQERRAAAGALRLGDATLRAHHGGARAGGRWPRRSARQLPRKRGRAGAQGAGRGRWRRSGSSGRRTICWRRRGT